MYFFDCLNVDCCSAEIIAIKKTYVECRIIVCYYHILKRLIQHLPHIKSTNFETKNNTRDSLNNMKILMSLSKNEVKIFLI